MPVTDMLLRGIELLVIGMGTVYAFLLLLIGLISLMARLIRRAQGEPSAAAIVGATDQESAGGAEVVAAIGAAIALYRARHGAWPRA